MIRITNLTKKYGERVILDNISYEFNNRGITCIFGASGSGKSTLFNLLAGFDRDYEGEIISDERIISKLSPNELADYRKTKIGFVFQEYNLVKGYTVIDNIQLAAELNNNSKEENIVLVNNLLKRLGIETKHNERVENLSGGQRQRVAIARALINSPDVIFADEPTGALDRHNASDIMEIFSEIAKDKLVVIITHDEKICEYADELIRIVDGGAEVIRNSDRIKEVEGFSHKKQKATTVAMGKRALKNFKNHINKFTGVALAVAIGVSSILFSLSSQNVIDKKIDNFKEKNTAFAYGQILLDEDITSQKVEEVIKGNQNIAGYYLQYALPESRITIGGQTLDFIPKQFNSVANEVMNIGVMPQSDEIAITPSAAKKISNDLGSLIGEKVIFTCDDFSKELTISGIFNCNYDNFYLGEDVEKELYSILHPKEPIALSYKANGFDEVLLIEKQLNEIGISPITASKQVRSFKTAFEDLKHLFFVVSAFITAIAFFISVMLLLKIAGIRAKEMGILMALGYRKTQIKQMLFIENMLVSIVIMIMTLLVITVSMVMSALTSNPLLLSSMNIIWVIFLAFVIVSAFTLFTSERLLKTDPAKVLRK